MALDPDMSFWINSLIFNKLADICPSLSLNGQDRKVYDICIKDFKNYIIYLDNNHLRIESNSSSMSPLDEIVSIMMGDTGLTQNLETTNEITEFVDMWVHWWFRKWTERTKIVLNKKDLPQQSTNPQMGKIPFTSVEQDEFMRALTDKLIQYGEICCTQIIAESLFKKDIEIAIAAGEKEWKMQEKLNFLSKLRREAKEVSYTHGPLVFIHPDDYFKLREWRNDGTNKIV